MAEIVAVPAALPDWGEGLVNLASPRLGSRAVSFAAMDRMLQDGPAVFEPGRYDTYGKYMDGWETRRRRQGGHDWCVIRLGARGTIRGVDIDTSHFTGNYPPAASLWASDAEAEPGDDVALWTEILPATSLGPSAQHYLEVGEPGPWRWLRLNIYPDGGIARLRGLGQPANEREGQN